MKTQIRFFSSGLDELQDGMDDIDLKAKFLSDAKERKLMEKLDEYDATKIEYEKERERKLRREFIGKSEDMKLDSQEKIYQKFLDQQKSMNEKIESHIFEKDSY